MSLMGSIKVKLGADAAAAAGPKGRTATAATDVVMRAEIFPTRDSRGLFAGVSLEAQPYGRTTLPMRNFTAVSSQPRKSYGRQSFDPAAARTLDADIGEGFTQESV